MIIENTNEDGLLKFAAKLANAVRGGAIIFLYGPLGAGKTTFARGFLRGLGYEGKVKSPTYTLIEPYEVAHKPIYHFDLYRLTGARELICLGVNEYFHQEAVCLVEWPEKGFPLLPTPDLACYIELLEQGRRVRLEARSPSGETILSRV